MNDFETPSCPLCGDEPGVVERYDFHPFRVVACNRCTLTFLSPRLTEARMLREYQGKSFAMMPGGIASLFVEMTYARIVVVPQHHAVR